MGAKYMIRTSEKREFPLKTYDYTDYYINSTLELIKLLIFKRKAIIYMTKWWK